MRWVNEILPPRPRCRWLLITVRLSMSSLAGTARTQVAVGTARLACMFETTRAAGPLSGVAPATTGRDGCGSPLASAGLASAGLASAGLATAGLASAGLTGAAPVV